MSHRLIELFLYCRVPWCLERPAIKKRYDRKVLIPHQPLPRPGTFSVRYLKKYTRVILCFCFCLHGNGRWKSCPPSRTSISGTTCKRCTWRRRRKRRSWRSSTEMSRCANSNWLCQINVNRYPDGGFDLLFIHNAVVRFWKRTWVHFFAPYVAKYYETLICDISRLWWKH